MFDLGTATWALSAKQAYLGMGCRGPAQSYLWHSAQHGIMPPLISVQFYSSTHSWVWGGSSSSASQSLYQTLGWAKCHLVLGFAQFSPGDAV